MTLLAAIPAIPAIDRWIDPPGNGTPPQASAPIPSSPSTTSPGGATTTTTRPTSTSTVAGEPDSGPALPAPEPPTEPPPSSPPLLPEPGTPSVPKRRPGVPPPVPAAILSPRDGVGIATRDLTVNGTAQPPRSPTQLWVIVQGESGRWYLYPTIRGNGGWSAQVLLGPPSTPRALPFRLVLVTLSSSAQAAVHQAWENADHYNDHGMAPFSSGVGELDTITVTRTPS